VAVVVEAHCRVVFAAGEERAGAGGGENGLIVGIPDLDGAVFVVGVAFDHRIDGGADEGGGGAEVVFGQVVGGGGGEADLGEDVVDLRTVDEFFPRRAIRAGDSGDDVLILVVQVPDVAAPGLRPPGQAVGEVIIFCARHW